MRRALVLGGGGVAGIAWEVGVLLGIADSAVGLQPAITDPDLIVGTSAGSAVAAQVASGTGLQALFDRQLADETSEIEVEFDSADMYAQFGAAAADATSAGDFRRRIAAYALAADTVDEPVRRQAVAGRLPNPEWSDREVLIPAVDSETGDRVVFTRHSGVDLLDAVTASCAVPGIWPPVTINGRRYVDGGIHSATNADLAMGCDRVLVILPAPPDGDPTMDHLPAEIELLRPAEVLAIHADDDSMAAFGSNPLSPATRTPAAVAGLAVGRRMADQVVAFWG